MLEFIFPMTGEKLKIIYAMKKYLRKNFFLYSNMIQNSIQYPSIVLRERRVGSRKEVICTFLQFSHYNFDFNEINLFKICYIFLYYQCKRPIPLS